MRMTILAGFVVLAAATGFAQAESAGRSCISKAGGNVLTVEALLTTMIEHGYRMRGFDTSEGCGKFRAVDKNGAEAVLFVDLSSRAMGGERMR